MKKEYAPWPGETKPTEYKRMIIEALPDGGYVVSSGRYHPGELADLRVAFSNRQQLVSWLDNQLDFGHAST